MVDNETLGRLVKPKLKGLTLSDSDQDRLVREINYLANLIIDGYLAKKNHDQRKAA